jgi:hypothetical protein
MVATNATLAQQLRAAADAVEQVTAGLADEQWDLIVPAEERTIGQLVDHIAWAWEVESAAFRAIAGGAPGSGWTQEWLDEQNAKQARLSAHRSRREIVLRFRQSRNLAIAFVNSLSPTDLERIGTHMPGEPERSVAGWIDGCLIGHPREHLVEIMAVIDSPTS